MAGGFVLAFFGILLCVMHPYDLKIVLIGQVIKSIGLIPSTFMVTLSAAWEFLMNHITVPAMAAPIIIKISRAASLPFNALLCLVILFPYFLTFLMVNIFITFLGHFAAHLPQPTHLA